MNQIPLIRTLEQKLEPYRNYLIREGFKPFTVDLFLAYHLKNEALWKLYQRKALELIQLGAERLSSKGIFERLREDVSLGKIGEFKAPNEFTPLYARIFVFKFPQYKNLFEFKSVGQKVAA